MRGVCILSNKISWAQSTSLYLLIFHQRNLVVINDLPGFPLWVFLLRSMAQWEGGTSLSFSFIDSSLHSREVSVSHTSLCQCRFTALLASIPSFAPPLNQGLAKIALREKPLGVSETILI